VVRYITENEEDTIYEPPPGAFLVLVVDGRVSQTFPVRGTIHLGRDRTNSVVVSDQKVSRHHAVLAPLGDAFLLTDQGSANGTFLNGVLISQPTRLKPQDKIGIGDTTFIFTTTPDSVPIAEPEPTRRPPPSLQPVPLSYEAPAPKNNSKVNPILALGQSKPLWMTLGCLGLIIVTLLVAVAVLLGLLIGRGQVAAMDILIPYVVYLMA
jgi:pSer/pThr/pTyr-binding forkhead associated (FHA) protein